MKNTIVSTTSLLLIWNGLASEVHAQGVTTPPGYLTIDGAGWQGLSPTGYSHLFGAYSNMRLQQMDGELKTAGARQLGSVAFRPDAITYGTNEAPGRNWTNVRLQLADGAIESMTNRFSTNAISTPTTVFSGSVAWPTITGTSTPTNWSPSHRFGFSANYLYSGQSDLLLDWTFSGGKLANNKTWSGLTARAYRLDGIILHTAAGFGRYETKTNGNCADSSRPSNANAYSAAQVNLYSPIYNSPTLADKAAVLMYTHNVAPNAPVVQAVGLFGMLPGQNIGARCNNLMIDLNRVAYIFQKTNSIGAYVTTAIIGNRSTFAHLGKSINVWSQAGWTDSVTGQLSLTSVSRCNPDFAYPLNTTAPKRKVVYQYNTTSATGYGPSVSDWYYLPITRYQ